MRWDLSESDLFHSLSMTCQAGVDILRFLSPNTNAMVKIYFPYHHVDLMTNELFVIVMVEPLCDSRFDMSSWDI